LLSFWQLALSSRARGHSRRRHLKLQLPRLRLKPRKLSSRWSSRFPFKIEIKFTGKNVNNPMLKNEVTAAIWYAPAIDHWVKRTFVSRANKHLEIDRTVELTEYGRKP
jgi:hypothetical protein